MKINKIIAPSYTGSGVVIVSIISLLIGFVYRNNSLYLFTSFLSSILILSFIKSYNIKKSNIIIQPFYCFVNEITPFDINITSDSNIIINITIEYSDNQRSSIDCVKINKGINKITIPGRLFNIFGKYTITSIMIENRSTGLWLRYNAFDINHEFSVYPQKIKCSYPENGQVIEYENKKFNNGDAIKSINWKLYAKTNQLYSKREYVEDGKSNQVNLIDLDRLTGSYHERLSKMTYLISDSFHNKKDFGIKLKNYQSPIANHMSHYLDCLEVIICE